MIYAGIDVSSKSFVVHAINNRNKVVFDNSIMPTKRALQKLLDGFGKETKYIVFEAGNQMKWIADYFLTRKDVVLHIVHPNEIKWINQSKKKTDQIDAKKLAKLAKGSILPQKVHVVTGVARRLRELAASREQLQSKRVSLINTVRGYVKQEGLRLPAKFFKSIEWKEKLRKSDLSETLKQIIESFMIAIDGLIEAELKITTELLAIEDERIKLLETIPCIGKLSSRVIVGAIDEVDRFENKKSIAHYTALTPRIHQSGTELHLGRIDFNGRREVRKILLQCAHTIVRTKNPDSKPLRDFFERISKKRGKKKAMVALARKLIVVAYGVLKNNECYDFRVLQAA